MTFLWLSFFAQLTVSTSSNRINTKGIYLFVVLCFVYEFPAHACFFLHQLRSQGYHDYFVFTMKTPTELWLPPLLLHDYFLYMDHTSEKLITIMMVLNIGTMFSRLNYNSLIDWWVLIGFGSSCALVGIIRLLSCLLTSEKSRYVRMVWMITL